MTAEKPIGSLSLDLDNLWSYLKTHGDPGWTSFPSYLDVVIPRVLKVLEELGLKITFFVVGQDAALPKNREALSRIPAAGHEVANHSFHHEPWLHLYPAAKIEEEFERAEEAIESATGWEPIGFRGPGFSFSGNTLRAMMRRGYHYDASTFPTFLGPLARTYYFLTTRLSPEEMEKRKRLFGKFSEGFRPIKPYRWRDDGRRLIEIPVTTLPGLKLPIHVSYVLYAGGFSKNLALTYFRTALRLCRHRGVPVSLLLHPLDFLGSDDVSELAFFPAMKQSAAAKVELTRRVIEEFRRRYNVVSMAEHAAVLARSGWIREVPVPPEEGGPMEAEATAAGGV